MGPCGSGWVLVCKQLDQIVLLAVEVEILFNIYTVV